VTKTRPDTARTAGASGPAGRSASVSSIFFKYFFAPSTHTVYRDPELYDDGVLSRLSRRDHLARVVADVVIEHHSPVPTVSALDVGAGTGILTLELARRGLTVVGLDKFGEALEMLQTKAARDGLDSLLHSVQADMNDRLPFPPSSFDIVTSLRANRYITDLGHLLSEIARVLRPGGLFVFPVFWVDAVSWRRRSERGFRQETSVRAVAEAINATALRVVAKTPFSQVPAKDDQPRGVPFYYRPVFIIATKPPAPN